VKNMAITALPARSTESAAGSQRPILQPKRSLAHLHDSGKGEPGNDTWKDDKNSAAAAAFDVGHGQLHPATDTIIWGVAIQARTGTPVSARRQSLYRQFARARCQH